MITKVPGFQVGHASDFKNVTGCTVILCPPGTVGGADVRGSAAGTRQMDTLVKYHLVSEVHAVLLTGGSAFGLDAAGGVMQFLEEQGRGFDVGPTRVPIVPAAVIYDLSVGSHQVRPDKAMGYAACQAARAEPQGDGSLGAGTGATVGKILGTHQATKSGLGTAFVEGLDGLLVGALVVVNALGDVVNPKTGEILAGARKSPESREFADSIRLLRRGLLRRPFGEPNTTIGVVATNARLNREQARKIAQLGHDALARCIRPVHTLFDGDTVFALAQGGVKSDLQIIGQLAETVLQQAIIRAVKSARNLGVLPAHRDLRRGRRSRLPGV
jgi:L-aminopeptidase/D-esterase-like protein